MRRQAGLKSGQKIEFKVCGGVMSIHPKHLAADDEYTAEQRRIVDAQLAEGLRNGHGLTRINTDHKTPAPGGGGRSVRKWD